MFSVFYVLSPLHRFSFFFLFFVILTEWGVRLFLRTGYCWAHLKYLTIISGAMDSSNFDGRSAAVHSFSEWTSIFQVKVYAILCCNSGMQVWNSDSEGFYMGRNSHNVIKALNVCCYLEIGARGSRRLWKVASNENVFKIQSNSYFEKWVAFYSFIGLKPTAGLCLGTGL